MIGFRVADWWWSLPLVALGLLYLVLGFIEMVDGPKRKKPK